MFSYLQSSQDFSVHPDIKTPRKVNCPDKPGPLLTNSPGAPKKKKNRPNKAMRVERNAFLSIKITHMGNL